MDNKLTYEILFKSIDEFKADEKNSDIYTIMEQSEMIRDQIDFLKMFNLKDENSINDIGYSRT